MNQVDNNNFLAHLLRFTYYKTTIQCYIILKGSLAYTIYKILDHPVYFWFLLRQVALNHHSMTKYVLRK